MAVEGVGRRLNQRIVKMVLAIVGNCHVEGCLGQFAKEEVKDAFVQVHNVDSLELR